MIIETGILFLKNKYDKKKKEKFSNSDADNSIEFQELMEEGSQTTKKIRNAIIISIEFHACILITSVILFAKCSCSQTRFEIWEFLMAIFFSLPYIIYRIGVAIFRKPAEGMSSCERKARKCPECPN